MKFKNLGYGHVFEVVHPWPDIPRRVMMKVVGVETHLNAVYLDWRLGTLDYIHDDEEVVLLSLKDIAIAKF